MNAPSRRRDILAHHGLRGMAALWVFFGHAELDGLFQAHPWVKTLYAPLYWHNYAVDVFFVLSGFVLNYVYLQDRPLSYGPFIRARLARLLPLYYVSVSSILAMNLLAWMRGSAWSDNFAPAVLIRNALLVQQWPLIGPTLPINFPSWSISTELFLYLVIFPAAALLPRRVRARWASVILPLMLIPAAVALFVNPLIATPNVAPTCRGIWGFLSGIFLCDFLLDKPERLPQRWELFLSAALLAGFLVIGRAFLPVGILLLVTLTYYPQTVLSRLFSAKICVYLGVLSYSVYLWHVPFLKALTLAFHLRDFGASADGHPFAMDHPVSPLRASLFCVTALGGLIALAHLSYFYLESPFRRWAKGSPRAPLREDEALRHSAPPEKSVAEPTG